MPKVDLPPWPYIDLPPSDQPIHHGKQDDEPQNRRRIIHIQGRHRLLGRKRQEDADEDAVHEREDVDSGAKAAEGPGTPGDRFAGEAFQHEAGDGDEVGDVEGDGREGDDGVEGGGGADVDEGEEEDDGGDEADGTDGDVVGGIDLE